MNKGEGQHPPAKIDAAFPLLSRSREYGPTAPTFRESSDLMAGYARGESPFLLGDRSLCSPNPLPCMDWDSETPPRTSLLGDPR